ncbi:hypothetical protein B0H16DRAFT_1512498, partial [Mycena metata]
MPQQIKEDIRCRVIQAGLPLRTTDTGTQTERNSFEESSVGGPSVVAQGDNAMQLERPGDRNFPGHHDEQTALHAISFGYFVSVSVCVVVGVLLAAWTWTGLPGTGVEETTAMSASSSNHSNPKGSSSATLANRYPYPALKEIIEAGDFTALADDDEFGATQVKAHLEELFPDLGGKGFTAMELQRHHRSLLFQAALLLHLSAALAS